MRKGKVAEISTLLLGPREARTKFVRDWGEANTNLLDVDAVLYGKCKFRSYERHIKSKKIDIELWVEKDNPENRKINNINGPDMAFLCWDLLKKDSSIFEETSPFYNEFKNAHSLSNFPKAFEFKNFPILFVACKVDSVNDFDSDKIEQEISEVADRLQIKNYDIAFTSAKENKDISDDLDNKVLNLIAKLNVSKKIAKDGDIDFQTSRFKHSRGVRVKHLRAVHLRMVNRELEDKALPDDEKSTKILSQKDVLWLLLHSQSIKDEESKTLSFIEKCISAYEDEGDDDNRYPFIHLKLSLKHNNQQEFIEKLNEVSGRLGISFRSEDDSSIAFDTIIKLLTLLDEKERKVFGYKIVLFQSSRDLVHREMGLIIDLAKHIYDYYVQDEKLIQSEENDNNAEANLEDPISNEILSNLEAKHNVTTPAEVEEIFSVLTSALNESSSVNMVMGNQ